MIYKNLFGDFLRFVDFPFLVVERITFQCSHLDSIPVPVYKGLRVPSESAESDPEDSGKDLEFSPNVSTDPKSLKLHTQAEWNDLIHEIFRPDRENRRLLPNSGPLNYL